MLALDVLTIVLAILCVVGAGVAAFEAWRFMENAERSANRASRHAVRAETAAKGETVKGRSVKSELAKGDPLAKAPTRATPRAVRTETAKIEPTE